MFPRPFVPLVKTESEFFLLLLNVNSRLNIYMFFHVMSTKRWINLIPDIAIF